MTMKSVRMYCRYWSGFSFVVLAVIWISHSVIIGQTESQPLSSEELHKLVVRCTSIPRIDTRGIVRVKVVIDKKGGVLEARSLNGHPLVKKRVADAVREATFRPDKRRPPRNRSGVVSVRLGTDMRIGNIRCM